MSYILDALRKADAQRARDPARGIHAQPAPSMAARPSRGARRGHWIGGGVAAVLLLAAVWIWFGPGSLTAAPTAPASAVRSTAMPPAPPLPATVVLPAAPPPAPAAVAPKVATPPPAQAAPPVADRTYSVAELPAEVRQALPKFSVSGGVYSGNAAQRMLVVDGQVFDEGSEIAPGVVLEQVRPKVALLRFRGQRIAQPY